jgi:hypothetical protein
MSTSSPVLRVQGTRLLLDGEPFYLQGLSFFNAVFNPAFNHGEDERLSWLRKFRGNGINMLRVWCQWDFPHRFADLAPDHALFDAEGNLREDHLRRLTDIIAAAASLGMVIEVTLFAQEQHRLLPVPAMERAARSMAGRLIPHRNVILQIWNERSLEVARCYDVVKAVDADRIVTNSPGVAGVLGDDEQNRMLDLLTPHTARGEVERFWEVAPRQVAALLETYRKPVIDDEPARTGLVEGGGIEGGTQPAQHIEQIRRVRAAGGYHVYHHDMFQNGYSHPATPPAGVPDPDFPFHRQVFAFLREQARW